ncbi:Uncharacterised protein [Mycobacteroides abscessus subsp. abscessus]|nr:hypothetical protein A3O06_03765 [Mycobacteroides abscessus]ANO22821.1 hypothetical protein BAB79_03765 [Mycobacteroides abscessus]SHS54879.1 Uncharacterised protein [Mycobacteroides abscessus subsp. abscessus]
MDFSIELRLVGKDSSEKLSRPRICRYIGCVESVTYSPMRGGRVCVGEEGIRCTDNSHNRTAGQRIEFFIIDCRRLLWFAGDESR